MIHFGTKAKTLSSLKDLLKKSLTCENVYFTVGQWNTNQDDIIADIQQTFPNTLIIARSSALNEDSASSTMAGAFESVNNIDSTATKDLIDAINQVIRSYGHHDHAENEVLIQEMVQDVSMSGVIFSHDLDTGAPYYVINYDDVSGATDTVTSGKTDTSRTLLVYRKQVDSLSSTRFLALIKAVQELESLSPTAGLDIEFIVTNDEKIYIVQVRRLAVETNWNRDISQHIDTSIEEIKQFVQGNFKPRFGVVGSTSILGEMPDWNPAEMIGAVPRPLARSLYEFLITDSVWAEARAEMGYRDLSGQPLMFSLGGRVYIDVRKSFNSFLPADLPDDIAEVMVNAWMKSLKDHPEAHDKVEFEVAISAYTFDFTERIKKYNDEVSEQAISVFKHELKALTNTLFTSEDIGIQAQLSIVEQLDANRQMALQGATAENAIIIAKRLLHDCAQLGTKPFSILARHAFVAEEFLRSLENQNLLSADEIEQFRASINTVLSDFLIDVQAVASGNLALDSFYAAYGHLRPGTYDILALRYDQREELIGSNKKTLEQTQDATVFELSTSQKHSINAALNEHGFAFDADKLIDYIKDSIAAREYAKLVFTRNISDALELIADWGMRVGLSRDEISFVEIKQILGQISTSFHTGKEVHFRNLSKFARRDYEISQGIRLPYLISEISDIYVVPLLKSRANFVTKQRIQTTVHYISGQEIEQINVAGQIVLIEHADPGYDWIFMMPIAGLITQYGGSNSHMAIRCAELGVPAAIGCGEQMFGKLKQSNSVLLDCSSGIVEPIN